MCFLVGLGNGGMGFNFGGSFESPLSSRPGQALTGSDILERTSHELKLEKSNILLLGPTGSGKSFIIFPQYTLFQYRSFYFKLNWPTAKKAVIKMAHSF